MSEPQHEPVYNVSAHRAAEHSDSSATAPRFPASTMIAAGFFIGVVALLVVLAARSGPRRSSAVDQHRRSVLARLRAQPPSPTKGAAGSGSGRAHERYASLNSMSSVDLTTAGRKKVTFVVGSTPSAASLCSNLGCMPPGPAITDQAAAVPLAAPSDNCPGYQPALGQRKESLTCLNV
ncbi:hypothetical protein RI367_004589 [Sorochytrium milnesiophthora]